MHQKTRGWFRPVLVILLAAFSGQAQLQTNIDVVAQTLQTYRVGKTLFPAFRQDTGFPATSDGKFYQMPTNGFWKLYEEGETRQGWFNRERDFVVGNKYRPLAILVFN